MSAITRDRLKEIFESGELDVTTRTKKLKDQETKLKAQEARIAELELLASTIKPKKTTTKTKKTMSDEEKQSLKDRLALGKAKKRAESQDNSIDIEKLINALKPEPKHKESESIKAKESESIKAKEPESVKIKDPEPVKTKDPEPVKTKESEPKRQEPEPAKPIEQPQSFEKYKKFLRNAYKPKYY